MSYLATRGAFFLAAALCMASPAGGQTPSKPVSVGSAAKALATTISIDAQNATAQEIFGRIAGASHIAITPELGVQLRRLTVVFRHTSAAEALNSICEMCGWAWEITANSGVMVHRRPVITASTPAAAAMAIASDLPPDLRRFLGVGIILAPRLTSHWLQGDNILPANYRAFKANEAWLVAAQRYLALELEEQVMSAMSPHSPISFASLSQKYKEVILSSLYLNAIPAGELYTFSGSLPPLATDPYRAFLVQAQDGTLHIQSAPGGTSGFVGQALGSDFHLK